MCLRVYILCDYSEGGSPTLISIEDEGDEGEVTIGGGGVRPQDVRGKQRD